MKITRFAPSPTGRLHLGHAYSARIAHAAARETQGAQGAQGAQGRFLLRFEDIDHTRVRPEFYEGILEDLRWLGLNWNGEPWKQLDRLPAYRSALEELKKLGVIYPCYCTRREIQSELAQLSSAPHQPASHQDGPPYPGTCRPRDASPPQQAQPSSTQSTPAWRLDCEKAAQLTGPLTFQTNSGEQIPVQANLLGDVILARKDIGTSYHLAVVVDDAAQGISHITRGQDLLPSTHIHRLLQSLLSLPEPIYLHHQLICDDSGERLAKRHDSLAIATLRARGHRPEELWEMLNALPKK